MRNVSINIYFFDQESGHWQAVIEIHLIYDNLHGKKIYKCLSRFVKIALSW